MKLLRDLWREFVLTPLVWYAEKAHNNETFFWIAAVLTAIGFLLSFHTAFLMDR